jgi:MOSC domain-containing protein YiiM
LNPIHRPTAELEMGLDFIRQSPQDAGELKMIVRRPDVNLREVLEIADLDLTDGLVGDNWKAKGSSRTDHGQAHPDMQLNIMNARAIEWIAQSPARWPLAGDQLYIDLDLSRENLPPGTRLALGDAIIEVTAQPHTGCKKFVERFGLDAMLFVNSEVGRSLNLRGINAKVIQPGRIQVGELATKL